MISLILDLSTLNIYFLSLLLIWSWRFINSIYSSIFFSSFFTLCTLAFLSLFFHFWTKSSRLPTYYSSSSICFKIISVDLVNLLNRIIEDIGRCYDSVRDCSILLEIDISSEPSKGLKRWEEWLYYCAYFYYFDDLSLSISNCFSFYII